MMMMPMLLHFERSRGYQCVTIVVLVSEYFAQHLSSFAYQTIKNKQHLHNALKAA